MILYQQRLLQRLDRVWHLARELRAVVLIVLTGAALGGCASPRQMAGISHLAATAVGPALVFDGMTVIDVERGERLREQRVVVVGNRITARGSRRAVQVPAGSRLVTADGQYLIPGLWNMHIHMLDTPRMSSIAG